MITRQDYMTGKATHREYYADVLRSAHISFSKEDPIVIKAAASKDKHYNDISLARWDSLALLNSGRLATAFKERNDFYSLAGGVCAMKEAVRQAVEHDA